MLIDYLDSGLDVTEEEKYSFNSLKEKYGVLMTLDEVSEILRYNSTASARKAHSRGQFPVTLYRFENKSGYYARVDEVINCLSNMQAS